MIGVTGATGTIGSVVVEELVARGLPVRGVSRTEEGAEAIRAAGAEAAVAELGDPATLERAFRGAERVLILSPPGPEQAAWEQNAVSVAEYAGVYAAVRIGMLGQAHGSPSCAAARHADATDALQGSSLRWTVLLAAPLMQDALAAVSGDRLVAPPGDARAAYVDARDVAAVAARCLAEPGHEQCTYTLTGPEALSAADLAATLGVALDASGGPATEHWADVLAAAGGDTVTADVQALLGRPPASFADVAAA